MELNPEFVGHIKLFLDNGLETVKKSVTIYYEEPQEDIIKSKEGAIPTLKILSAVSNVKKEALKDAVNSSVQETFEKRGIDAHKAGHDHDNENGQKHGHGHHGHEQHGNVQRIVSIEGRKESEENREY